MRKLKPYMWSVLLFGCESWTISKEMRKRPESMEKWFLRIMLRVPWTARRTNMEVFQMGRTKRELNVTIKKRQLRLRGYTLRRERNEKDCLLGVIERTRGRGRH